MLKNVPSFVLVSLKASTYRPRDKEPVSAGSGWAGEMLRLGFSLTAASLDDLFEHPAPLPRQYHGINRLKTFY